MSNKKNFLKLVSDKKTNTLERSRTRIKKRKMLRESQKIALKILNRLDELGWTQKKLADEIGVSPQQINKIVRGKENLTLETQIELQTVLNIPILASYYNNRNRIKVETQKSFFISFTNTSLKDENYNSAKKITTLNYGGVNIMEDSFNNLA